MASALAMVLTAAMAIPGNGTEFTLLNRSPRKKEKGTPEPSLSVVAPIDQKSISADDGECCCWPGRCLFAVIAGQDTGNLSPDNLIQAERVRACEQGVSQAMREAHAFLHGRAEQLQAPLRTVVPRPRSSGRVRHQEVDHIEQVIRWVKDPIRTFLPENGIRARRRAHQDGHRYRTVRPHERQRHYRRQHFGKGRREVKVIEIRATIIHREWFNGGPGDIDVRYIASRH